MSAPAQLGRCGRVVWNRPTCGRPGVLDLLRKDDVLPFIRQNSWSPWSAWSLAEGSATSEDAWSLTATAPCETGLRRIIASAAHAALIWGPRLEHKYCGHKPRIDRREPHFNSPPCPCPPDRTLHTLYTAIHCFADAYKRTAARAGNGRRLTAATKNGDEATSNSNGRRQPDLSSSETGL